jgi:hypothetical protein
MRRTILTLAFSVLVTSACLLYTRSARPTFFEPAVTDDGIAVYFSPKGGCTEAIVEQIAKARSTIDM